MAYSYNKYCKKCIINKSNNPKTVYQQREIAQNFQLQNNSKNTILTIPQNRDFTKG